MTPNSVSEKLQFLDVLRKFYGYLIIFEQSDVGLDEFLTCQNIAKVDYNIQEKQNKQFQQIPD